MMPNAAGSSVRSLMEVIMRTFRTTRIALLLIPLTLVAESAGVHAASACLSQPNSNVGCEFYAVSLPNWFVDQTTFHFGVAMLNTSGSPVVATITGGGLFSPEIVALPSGAGVTSQLPWVPAISTSLSTVKVVGGAYHIALTGPASAIQLNSIEPQISLSLSSSNDASLLLAVQSAGRSYRAVVAPTWGSGGSSYPGNIAVVATVAGTIVQVVAPGTIQPGAGLSASGGTVSLDQGDVLLIASALDASSLAYGSDLSGTQITSNSPVLVWTSHAFANVPAGVGYADHLEESLPPISALSNDYFIVRAGVPSADTGSKISVKIVGVIDGTSLSYNPTIVGAPSSIDAGNSVTFEASTDFHLQSSNRVAVAVFMQGGLKFVSGNGDPSQSIPIPTNQRKMSIDFIALTNLAPIFAQLVAPSNSTILVDSNVVSGWTVIGDSGYSTTHVTLCCTDSHHASGDQPFTLSVHAYPAGSTSYWYPGGLGIDDDLFHDGFE